MKSFLVLVLWKTSGLVESYFLHVPARLYFVLVLCFLTNAYEAERATRELHIRRRLLQSLPIMLFFH